MAAPVPVTTSARTGSPRAYTPALLATKILASQQEVVGECKYATVLVAGVEGLPALRQIVAPEAVDDILNRGFAQVVAAVHQVEGFITQITPHGGTALFGVPLACEDHVLRALHAALGMQRAFAAFAAALHQTHRVVAVIGPEVSLPVLQTSVEWPEDRLHQSLTRLQAAKLLYETHAAAVRTYTFKHALVQDAAYQTLLPSTRQQYHRQIGQVLAEGFPEVAETQPELLAHHYTEAGLTEQAIAYWQRVGARASQRLAHLEAIAHLNKGLGLLMTLPDTPGRARQEIVLRFARFAQKCYTRRSLPCQ